jgi:protein TonB
MSYHIHNEQKLNDIIFANRNQAYGAYALRSSYGETVLKSLSMMIIGVGTLFGTAFYLSHKNDESKLFPFDQVKDSVYVIPVYFPPEEIIKPEENRIMEPPAPASKPLSAAISTNIKDSVRSENSDTSLTLISSTHTLAELTNTLNGISTLNNSVTVTNTLVTDTRPVGQVKGALEVDTQPEFEGGLPALYRFIGQHLKYPEIASREGQEGKVYVRFVVDENGKVGDLTLLNMLGYGMDEEALRVVGLIPKFKTPAKVKGVPVKVYYQLPIRFKYRY